MEIKDLPELINPQLTDWLLVQKNSQDNTASTTHKVKIEALKSEGNSSSASDSEPISPKIGQKWQELDVNGYLLEEWIFLNNQWVSPKQFKFSSKLLSGITSCTLPIDNQFEYFIKDLILTFVFVSESHPSSKINVKFFNKNQILAQEEVDVVVKTRKTVTLNVQTLINSGYLWLRIDSFLSSNRYGFWSVINYLLIRK
jgi:hypothetical protein